MRICLINEFFYPDDTGGTGNVLSDLAKALRRNHDDLQIDVVTSRNSYRRVMTPARNPNDSGKVWEGKRFRFAWPPGKGRPSGLRARDEWQGIEIFRLGTPHPNNRSLPMRLAANLMFTFAALLFLFRRRSYDLVLVATAPPMASMAALVYKLFTGTPYLYVVYDLEPDLAVNLKVVSGANPFAALFRVVQARCLRSAAKVVVLGRCMKERLRKSYRLNSERVEVVPVGYDPGLVWPMSRQSRFRAEQGIDDKFVVLYSGNLGRHHDFDTVLNAAKKLQASRPDIVFALVGGGYQKEYIAARVKNERIENVALYEFVAREDLSDLLASADVSLVTLERQIEGLCVPSKFYSVMASGRPIIAIASPETEMSRVIEEAGCGIRVGHKAADELVEAVIRLADDRDTRERMGANGRKALIERYTTEQAAQAYYSLFCAVSGGQLAPARPAMRSDKEPAEVTLR